MTIPNGSLKSGSPAGPNTQSLIPLNQSDSNVYARLLLPKGHGYPLWIPETDTNLPLEYRRNGVKIGDVGIVTDDGGFDYLFNICLPANDPVNKGRVPRDFQPLDASLDIRNNPTRFKPGADISSSFIKKSRAGETQESSTFTFTPSCEEGAVLVLPEGGSRSDLRNQGEFRRYAAQNAASWYQFVNANLGWDISNGTMYLVTGCDKTSSWGNAVFSNVSGASDVTMEFGPKPSTDPTKSAQYIWTKDGSASVRYGPDEAESDEGRQANQCIFLRGFRICVSPGIFADSFRKPNGNEVSTHVVRKPQAYHPSVIVNEFIFNKTSGVDVILAHDEQWPSLLNENDTIVPENEELIRRTFSKFNLVIDNGVAHLEPTSNQFDEQSGDVDQAQGKPKLAITTKNEANGTSNHQVKLPSKNALSPRSSSLGMSAAELLRLQQTAPIPSPTSYRQMASNDLVAKSPLRSRAINNPTNPSALSPTVRFAETYGGSSKDSSVASSPQLDARARIISPQNLIQAAAGNPSPDGYTRVVPTVAPGLANGGFEGQDGYGQDLGSTLVMAHHRLQPQYLGPYYIVSPQVDGGFQSPATSSSVASQDTRYSNNRNPGLYKTEVCRSWEEKGWCRYGTKCQFAHGHEDLRDAVRHPKYKTEICRTFWATGSCPYGNRCCFIHTEVPGQPEVAVDGIKPATTNLNGHANEVEKEPASLLTRLDRLAIRAQDLATGVDSPSSAGGNTSALSGPRKGSLRIDTSGLDGPSVQNKSAFPSFARNRDNLPPSNMLKSPAAVTAGVVWDDPGRRVVR